MLDKLSLLIPELPAKERCNLRKNKGNELVPQDTSTQVQVEDERTSLQEKERIKSQILATFTREILSSMRSIMELLEYLLSFMDDKDKKEMEIIFRNTRRLMELSAPLVEIFQNIFLPEKAEEKKLLKSDKEFMEQLNKVIEKNHSDPDFSVERLAKILCMSKSSLYRKIYDLTGESPSDFIRSFRLDRAAQLIRRNFGSVTKVAFEVGFNSRTYFAKCFKEKFHHSPSNYKTQPPPKKKK